MLAPLGLTRRHIFVDNGLRTVGEVTELCFPRDDGMGIADGIAVFKSHARELGQRGVVDEEAATVVAVLRQLLQRVVFVGVFGVDVDRVALGEGTAAGVLTGQANEFALTR